MFRTNNCWLKEVYLAAPTLMLSAFLMLPDIAFCIGRMFVDQTIITGAPAWIKPLKFGISTLIYTLSLAVVVRYTATPKGAMRLAEFLTGVAITLEIIVIDIQAARHTTSHFNVATTLDKSLWFTMGIGILILWISGIVITIATFRSFYYSRPWTIAVRYGMLIALFGMASGAFMAFPSHDQRTETELTHRMPVAGSHTIGGTDGGPGLPVLHWSTEHGDVRVAHFVGIHAIQVFALLAFLLGCFRIPEAKAANILYAVVVSYGSLFVVILAEALMRNPITDHNTDMLSIWIIWSAITAAMLTMAIWRTRGDSGRYDRQIEIII